MLSASYRTKCLKGKLNWLIQTTIHYATAQPGGASNQAAQWVILPIKSGSLNPNTPYNIVLQHNTINLKKSKGNHDLKPI